MQHEPEGAGKQVISRAAAVLRALERDPRGLSLTELARASKLPRTTANRIVVALEVQQFVIAIEGRVRLGPAITRLAVTAHADIAGAARPHLEAIGRRLRETVHFSIRRGAHAITIDQCVSDHELRVVTPAGVALPLHCTAHGMALLAVLPDATVERLLGSTLEAKTSKTISSLGALMSRLALIRKAGFGYDEEEHAAGVCGIGVFVETNTPDHYAISVVAPIQRFHPHVEAFRAALLQCKAAIEVGVGIT